MNSNILIYIFNYKNDNNARKWYNFLSPYFEVHVLDSGNDKECNDFIQYPNIYYSGLFNEVLKLYHKTEPKYVGIICSDVIIDEENANKLISKLNWLLDIDYIGVYQPSADKDSKSWLGYNNGTNNIEEKTLLEGWFHIIKKDVIDKILPIDINVNLYGWGIDNVTCSISRYLLHLKNIKDNSIIVHHPKGTGYDEKKASKEGPIYLKKASKEYNIPFNEIAKS